MPSHHITSKIAGSPMALAHTTGWHAGAGFAANWRQELEGDSKPFGQVVCSVPPDSLGAPSWNSLLPSRRYQVISESPPQMAITNPALGNPLVKVVMISTTISSAFPRIPAQAVALLKALPLSMIAEINRHANSMRGTPARLCPSASIACPAAANRALCASVVATAYWPLRESIGKALLLAR